MNWKDVENKKVKPEFKPKITEGDETCVDNFDPEFTNESNIKY